MRGFRVLKDGLTFCGVVRHAGETVLEADIDWRLLGRLQEEAPEVGNRYRDILEVVEVDEASLESLLLEVEPLQEGVEGPHLHREVGSGAEWMVGKDGRPICAFPLGDGRLCEQITSPGARCRHHRQKK